MVELWKRVGDDLIFNLSKNNLKLLAKMRVGENDWSLVVSFSIGRKQWVSQSFGEAFGQRRKQEKRGVLVEAFGQEEKLERERERKRL